VFCILEDNMFRLAPSYLQLFRVLYSRRQHVSTCTWLPSGVSCSVF